MENHSVSDMKYNLYISMLAFHGRVFITAPLLTPLKGLISSDNLYLLDPPVEYIYHQFWP